MPKGTRDVADLSSSITKARLCPSTRQLPLRADPVGPDGRRGRGVGLFSTERHGVIPIHLVDKSVSDLCYVCMLL